MANQNELTTHEMLELHEILCNETLGIKKIESMISMVKDQELASYIKNNVTARRENLKGFQELVFDKTLQ
ncbi:hypothetical protein [Desulfosporosinus hippei]|uniref:Similar to spore coat protein n=1 Tax=Desulfosporosinus hippei DSM 8344 TaxID=1121419 RepID=A0A1G8IFG6_9FIRM|nr:hypothetical protein [Desulfosporosinus hippei]SDI17655.1 similar to spore coat protein [Desulfosporosinus hippei DSM 8344]